MDFKLRSGPVRELHLIFDAGRASGSIWESYAAWTLIRSKGNAWLLTVIGYCEWQFLDLPSKMGSSTAVYSFVDSVHLRQFKLWCELHGLHSQGSPRCLTTTTYI